jgi:Family of unknown function (DUF6297)
VTTAGSAFGEADPPAEVGVPAEAAAVDTDAPADFARRGRVSDVAEFRRSSTFDEPEDVAVRLLRRRLGAGSRAARRIHRRPTDIYVWILAVVVLGAIAAQALRPLARLVTGSGWALPHAPGRLFAAAAALLLLGGLAQLLRATGPVTASSAFRFWLLAAPVSRRRLLGRRFVALLAAIAVLAGLIAGLVAHAASVAVLPVIAMVALGAIAVTAASVWGQASDAGERVIHAIGRSLSAVAVLGFGSLATGIGRADANAALHAPPAVVDVLLAVLVVAASVCGWRAYRALDQIGVGVLRRGQGLWTAGRAAAASMDAFMLADFLAEQRARATGRVQSVRMGGSFAVALTRSEWVRLRRRPYLAVRAAVAAIVWWGCRPVLPGPALAALALLTGFFLVLPLPSTLKQLASGPGLRAQFANHDRWLGRASVGVCLLGVAVWAGLTIPGLAGSHRVVLAIIITIGIAAAVCRAVTRPPLDYSKPPVPTPFGDLPLDLWRQLFRGPLLLAVLLLVVLRIR